MLQCLYVYVLHFFSFLNTFSDFTTAEILVGTARQIFKPQIRRLTWIFMLQFIIKAKVKHSVDKGRKTVAISYRRGKKKKTLERWGEQAAGAWVSTGLTLILMWSWCGEFNEWQSIIMCSLVWCAFLHPPSLGLSRTTWRMCGRKRRSGGHDRLKTCIM